MKTIIIITVIISAFTAFAQEIQVDGLRHENHWHHAIEITNFKTYIPDFGLNPSEKTIVYLTSDSRNMYIAAVCHDKQPDKILANLTNRDNLKNDDTFTVEMDIGGSANANIFFTVNPLGIQEDGFVFQNEETDLNPDKVWYSKGMLTDSGYQVEIVIPFQSLRYKWKPEVEIKMGFKRKIFRKSEVVVYPEYKPEISNRLMQRKAFSFSNIEKKKTCEVIPSVTYSNDQKYNEGVWNSDYNKIETGVTAKFGLNSDLILDLTYNPDFSQIESDAGQIDFNLRSPLYYPEKRPFFQEGVELYNFGAQDMWLVPLETIVNTRNIIDPQYGIKLTGNIGKKYSIASILSKDEHAGNNDQYQVIRLRRKYKNDTFWGLFYTGKESTSHYNRVGGFDGNIRINGKSSLEFHFFRSFTGDNSIVKTGNCFGAFYKYNYRYHNFKLGYYQTDKEFETQIGYLNRVGIQILPISYTALFPVKSKWLKKAGYIFHTRQKNDMNAEKYEQSTSIGFQLNFNNDSWIQSGKTFASEVYQNRVFDTNQYRCYYFIQLNKYFALDGYISRGNRIYYDDTDPYQGYGWQTDQTLQFSPTHQLKIKLSVNYVNFYRKSDRKFIYDYTLARIHTTYQLNQYLFLRTIGEYNFYKDQLSTELLISFTLIPGTVMQLGYNMNANRHLQDKHHNPVDALRLSQKQLFFKASYLFTK